MHKAIFEVQALTPLFLGGAEQTSAELRAPALRGLMRYWLRALLGGMAGCDAQGLAQVQQAESALFGTTERGSTVSITISTASHAACEFNEPISVRRGEKWQATGKGYLLWSMARSGRHDKGNFKPARWYFPAGTSFHVTLATRGDHQKQLLQAIAAFWLLTHFGGLGSRARRCAGSVAARLISDIPTDLPFTPAEHAYHLKQQLEQGLSAARALQTIEPRTIQDAHFDMLAHKTCRIWILQDEQPWPDEEIAMQKIGEKLQVYRNHIDISQRTIFGLPLPPLIFKKRRASPLLLRLTKLNNGYVGIAVLFKTLSSDIRIEEYALIEQWASTFYHTLEVMV